MGQGRSSLLAWPNRWREAHFWVGLAVLLSAGAIVSRWPDRKGFFQNDDFIWLDLAHWRSVAQSFVGPFGGPDGALMAYRPIFRVSVYIDALLFGQHAVPWHIENIVIHAANALLLAAVMRAFRLPRGLCAAAALLFLVAPHNSESIDWISGRTAALSFLFMELAAWRWVLAVRDRRMPWAAAIWMLMSAGTYEPGVALPVILLCLVPLLAKTIDVDWRYAARQTLPLFLSLAVFLIFRGFMLGTPVGETAPTNMNLLENSSDHLAALWRANLATGTAISRWVLIVAVLVTSLHPRLFPAGPCLVAVANVLLLPFITTPGAGSRFFYMLQAPLCAMAVLPVLLAPVRFRLPILAVLLALVLPGLARSSRHEAQLFAGAGDSGRKLFQAVHRVIPKNIGYANVVEGIPDLINGRMMAGAFFESGLAETYHDPALPPPFTARTAVVLGSPQLLQAVLSSPAKFWRYDLDAHQMIPITREDWLAAHPEAAATLPKSPGQ